ncbi:MAG: hypothetical protein ACE5IB_03300, partial [Candidatus Geothermarchaeales archaeon]
MRILWEPWTPVGQKKERTSTEYREVENEVRYFDAHRNNSLTVLSLWISSIADSDQIQQLLYSIPGDLVGDFVWPILEFDFLPSSQLVVKRQFQWDNLSIRELSL